MALSTAQATLVKSLTDKAETFARLDDKYGKYYEGTQVLEHIGLAVPPELRRFETIINWSRVAVDSV